MIPRHATRNARATLARHFAVLARFGSCICRWMAGRIYALNLGMTLSLAKPSSSSQQLALGKCEEHRASSIGQGLLLPAQIAHNARLTKRSSAFPALDLPTMPLVQLIQTWPRGSPGATDQEARCRGSRTDGAGYRTGSITHGTSPCHIGRQPAKESR